MYPMRRCYMNAVLQCLNAVPELVRAVLREPEEEVNENII